jgi:hypothetical protein
LSVERVLKKLSHSWRVEFVPKPRNLPEFSRF